MTNDTAASPGAQKAALRHEIGFEMTQWLSDTELHLTKDEPPVVGGDKNPAEAEASGSRWRQLFGGTQAPSREAEAAPNPSRHVIHGTIRQKAALLQPDDEKSGTHAWNRGADPFVDPSRPVNWTGMGMGM